MDKLDLPKFSCTLLGVKKGETSFQGIRKSETPSRSIIRKGETPFPDIRKGETPSRDIQGRDIFSGYS